MNPFLFLSLFIFLFISDPRKTSAESEPVQAGERNGSMALAHPGPTAKMAVGYGVHPVRTNRIRASLKLPSSRRALRRGTVSLHSVPRSGTRYHL